MKHCPYLKMSIIQKEKFKIDAKLKDLNLEKETEKYNQLITNADQLRDNKNGLRPKDFR